jgi:hypothetical protein
LREDLGQKNLVRAARSRKMVKGEKKSRVNDIVTREYTINLHKRLFGV